MAVERLQKVLAASGVASRRASEVLIAAGRVTVDGKVATLGSQVDPDKAIIAVDGRVIGAASAAEYLLLHKPAGVTSTVRDRHASRTVLDLLPTALVPEGARLYPVGRLDQDSEGLLILTNDGAWADRVLHPRHGVEREYAVGPPRAAVGGAGRRPAGRDPARRGPGHADRPARDDRDRDAPPRGAARAAARRAGLVSGDPRPGLETPAPPDVRRGRGADRAARPGPDRSGPARRPASGRARRLRAPEVRGLAAGAGASRAGAGRPCSSRVGRRWERAGPRPVVDRVVDPGRPGWIRCRVVISTRPARRRPGARRARSAGWS